MKVTRTAVTENRTNKQTKGSRPKPTTEESLVAKVSDLEEKVLHLERTVLELRTFVMLKREKKSTKPTKIDVQQDDTTDAIKDMLRELHPELYR